MSKVLDQFTDKYGHAVEVIVANVRECPQEASMFQVRFVPTLVFMDETGKLLDKRTGYMPLSALVKNWSDLGYDLMAKE
ncbi:MAG: hypothetical protein GX310_06255 [Synergistaceae bacterium]|nr:hypothetical protein [Synergistaceae bacterium]